MIVDKDLVRRARMTRGWSQPHLAEVMEVSPRTIQRVEREGRASLETMQTLCAVLDLAPETLCAPDAPPPAPVTRAGLPLMGLVFAIGLGIGALLAQWVG